ncbi:hypothetical protein pEaSNUABM56_00109 [Erwinia phage pEa_SNUABM_56]|uniref:Putative tape measure protein n=1 Tax=Erwinia phage pEp_SNUABM_01 TaxID=2601643 RepID=A0A5J6DAQ8_9CAUD|nr:tail length tape measure protein [Erwinia phage pEp_SNUABM_01]QEQ94908.1 putative tape measure protein [Erwinia phage pEp_SNUABM_01]UYL84838.1 hypothetical protein pEaSNUABM55_00040 [Erwinia phage pEa_SNUABM_55]UYL85154.1 hypothetical protein pEaSNUABM56_00109 [Erwinia phage pEa_SNUABM_56]
MAGNIIVTTTVNKVTWQVDKTAYGKALKQVKSLKKEWEKVGSSVARKNNPAEKLLTAAQQAKLVTKRLAQTERNEAAKSTAHAIALAKKEANARATIAKRESARRKQAVGGLTNNRSPEGKAEYSQLRNWYKSLEKEHGPDRNNGQPRRPIQMNSPAGYSPSGLNHFGKPGQQADPEGRAAKAQVDAMNRGHRQMAAEEKKREAQAAKSSANAQKQRAKDKAARDKADRADEAAIKRRDIVVGNAQRRLENQLGPKWRKKVKGFDSLADSFALNKGDISQFNSQIGQMIRNAKNAAGQTVTLGDSIKNLRRTLIGVTAAYSAFNGAASVLAAGQFFESTKATMLMVSDTTEEAGKKMQFVQDQSYRLGLDLKVASQGFTQMAVSAKGVISDKDTNNLFKSLSEFATASGADSVKYQRGITAIGQMLGKGQIQAEELKGQLSEALPGSMQAFVRAAQKYFKDDKIGVPELQDLMKNGKLLAKDILPLVANEFAEAARKNGALTAQMNSNRVAMERMRQSWMKFKAEIFEGGFGDEMTKLFNTLAAALHSSGPLGKALGEFGGGFVRIMRLIVEHAFNTFTLITAIIDKFLEKLGMQKDSMNNIWNWAGMIVGALLFANALARILGIIKAIAGMGATLKLLKSLFGGGDGDDDDEGGSKKKKNGFGNKAKGLMKKGGIIGSIIGGSMLLGDVVFDAAQNYSDDTFGTETTAGGNLKKNTWAGRGWDWLAGQRSQTDANRLDYLQKNGLMPTGGSGSGGALAAPPPQKVEVEVTTKVDAGALEDMISQQIKTSTMQDINLLAGVPPY